jgi:hypothetical protein
MGNSTPKELNDLGRTKVNGWTEQRQWKHRFAVHDIVQTWMTNQFKSQNIPFNNSFDLVSFCASKPYRGAYPKGPNLIFKIVDSIKEICFNNAEGKNIFKNYETNKWKLYFICEWNPQYTMTAAAAWMHDDKDHVCYIDVAEKFFCPDGEPMPAGFSINMEDAKEPNMFGILYKQQTLRRRSENIFAYKTNWNMYDENLMALIILLEHEMIHALLEGLYPGEDEKSGTPEGREDEDWDDMHQRLFCTLTERMFGHKEINSHIGEIRDSNEYKEYRKRLLIRERQRHTYNLRSVPLKDTEAIAYHKKNKLKF